MRLIKTVAREDSRPTKIKMKLTVDLSGLPLAMRERIVKHVAHEDAAQFAIAQVEQAKLKALYDSLPPSTREGIGPRTSVCHVGLKNFLAAKFGHRTVYSDPDFMPWLAKKHEEFRGRDVRTKIMTGYTGTGKSEIGNRKTGN